MSHFLFLNGSTRLPEQTGNTVTLARLAAKALSTEVEQNWLDLARLSIPPFEDRRHTSGIYPMPEDDARILLDATLSATDLVFVSPVYWFSIPAPLKTYLDHWSGWMRIPGLNFKEKMQGKNLWIIATSGNRDKAQPMFDSYHLCADFLGLYLRGVLWGKGGAPDAVLEDKNACADAVGFFTTKTAHS